MQNNMFQIENHNQTIENSAREIYFENFRGKSLLIGHSDRVSQICICYQRNLLASVSLDRTIKLWNLDNNSLIQTFECTETLNYVVFSNLGNLLAFGYYQLMLVDISDLKTDNIAYKLLGYINDIFSLTFTHDSKYLISSCIDYITIWDCKSKEEKIKIVSIGCFVAISADDTLMATNSDKNIQIWNFKTQKLICSKPEDQQGIGIEFSNNQKMLVTGGYEGLIKLWSLKELNKSKLLLIRKFKVGNDQIYKILISPLSRFIISMCIRQSSIKVIDLQIGKIIKKLKFNWKDYVLFGIAISISKNIDIIAYGEDMNIVVLRQQ